MSLLEPPHQFLQDEVHQHDFIFSDVFLEGTPDVSVTPSPLRPLIQETLEINIDVYYVTKIIIK